MRRTILLSACLIALLLPSLAPAAELTVGPGKAFATPAEASPRPPPATRSSSTLATTTPLRAGGRHGPQGADHVQGRARQAVAASRLERQGLRLLGRGPVPRAIFQFDPQADGCVLEGFELFDAHNDEHNGAGVRINQANDVTVRNCEIHDNDMGIMSNGNGTTAKAGVNQRIEGCLIHSNGNAEGPRLQPQPLPRRHERDAVGCEVHSSLTGHNVKSRAHLTRVRVLLHPRLGQPRVRPGRRQGRYDRPGSDAVLRGQRHRQGPPSATATAP